MTLLMKKHFERTKSSDIIQMINLFIYLQRKEEKKLLEILYKNQNKELY
jgi:chemotaxis methyl-accepting protein methylase